MKFTRSLHGTDILELNEEDLKLLNRGNHLKVNGMIIALEVPDSVVYYSKDLYSVLHVSTKDSPSTKLKVTYDGRTGEMKTAEVLK